MVGVLEEYIFTINTKENNNDEEPDLSNQFVNLF